MTDFTTTLYIQDGKWHVNVYWPATKRRLRKCLGTADEAAAEKRLKHYIAHELPNIDANGQNGPTLQPPPESPLLTKLFDHYCDVILVGRGRARKTQTKARQVCDEFAAFARSRHCSRIDQISPKIVDEYFLHCRKNLALAPKTVQDRGVMLRACILALVDSELIGQSPVRKWAIPKAPERTPDTPYSFDEIRGIHQAVRAGDPDIMPLVEFITMTGCRPVSGISLERHHLDIASKLITMTDPKTARVVEFEISDEAVKLIMSQPQRPNTTRVFLDSKSREFTVNSVNKRFKRALAGTPHAHATLKRFRPTFAYHMLNTFHAPLPTVQKALGHLLVTTTMRYLKRAPGEPYTSQFSDAIKGEKLSTPPSDRVRRPKRPKK